MINAINEARSVGQWLGATDAPNEVICAQERVLAALEEAEERVSFQAEIADDEAKKALGWRDRAIAAEADARQKTEALETAEDTIALLCSKELDRARMPMTQRQWLDAIARADSRAEAAEADAKQQWEMLDKVLGAKWDLLTEAEWDAIDGLRRALGRA